MVVLRISKGLVVRYYLGRGREVEGEEGPEGVGHPGLFGAAPRRTASANQRGTFSIRLSVNLAQRG